MDADELRDKFVEFVNSLVVLMPLKDRVISVIRSIAEEVMDPALLFRRFRRRLALFFEFFVIAVEVLAIATVGAVDMTDEHVDVLSEGAVDCTTSTLKLSSSSS
mmetsp:Transcript_6337/g.9760  ORF Transcript_6337/g.9760 Transcript_6337/m.9760 type:complete len:104 (-) Transcript_6337:281-592(-)